MKSKTFFREKLHNQHGAVLVVVAILFSFVFIGLLAFAIDIGHLTVVKNELQNAADAGALAGAADLYWENGGRQEVNPGANQTAYDTATQNQSDQVAVEIYNPASNLDDVQRGHWNPKTRTFTPNNSTDTVSLLGVDASELNKMDGTYEYQGGYPVFINAVKVTAWRGNASVQNTSPVTSFFARIFGIDSFVRSAEAVAWLGYRPTILKDKVDLPLALCEESLLTNEEYDCNIGREINSGEDPSASNTGGWTNFAQDLDGPKDSCPGTASTNSIKELMESYKCGEAINDSDIQTEWGVSTNSGQDDTVYQKIYDCWKPDSSQLPETSWSVVLPVVLCEGKNIGDCPIVQTVIRVDIICVGPNGTPKAEDDAPKVMDDWVYATEPKCTEYKSHIGTKNLDTAIDDLKTKDTIYTDMPTSVIKDRWQGESDYSEGIARWDCFTDYFQLRNADGNYAALDKKSIYFRPECSVAEDAMDGVGSYNTGALTGHPVLVE